jgi:vancomycin resistance protein VanJ
MLLLRVFVGEGWIVVAVLNSGLHLLLMPALVVLPLCLLFPRWRLALVVLPPFTLFVLWYSAFFLPNSVTLPPDATTVRLLTYNLHAERNLFEPMARVICDVDADIVALQEMTQEAAAYLDEALADMYPYRALHPSPNYYYGRGVLSRYPLTDDYAWPETEPITVRLQRVTVDIGGTDVALYNFHAPPSYPIFGQPYDIGPRRQQIEDLVGMAAVETSPVLLVGDFNTTYLDENYQYIRQHFTDSYYEVGWGLGFTNPDWRYENAREGSPLIPPYNRLDYVFHSAFFTAVEARIWPDSGGSDHLPMVAVLLLARSM